MSVTKHPYEPDWQIPLGVRAIAEQDEVNQSWLTTSTTFLVLLKVSGRNPSTTTYRGS